VKILHANEHGPEFLRLLGTNGENEGRSDILNLKYACKSSWSLLVQDFNICLLRWTMTLTHSSTPWVYQHPSLLTLCLLPV